MKNYIFGTGNFGKLTALALRENKIEVSAFIDLNLINIGTLFDGLSVLSVDQVEDGIVYIASNRNNHRYLQNLISDKNPHKKIEIRYPDHFLKSLTLSDGQLSWSAERCNSEIENFLFMREVAQGGSENFLKSIDIVLTEKCSLKCIDCSNLMQYYEKAVDTDLHTLLESIDKLFSALQFVKEVRIIGGEPLMFKEIVPVIQKIKTFHNFGSIVIFTNGTIMPRDELMAECSNSSVRFQISDYGDLSRNVEKLEALLIEKEISNSRDRVLTWQDCASLDRKVRTKEELLSVFSNCCVNDAFTLLHGKLYGCPFAAHAENLDAIPELKSDSIDIGKENSEGILKKIANLVNRSNYGACNYCNGRDYTVGTVEAAVQTKYPLRYLKVH
ncbi:radical SAM protein [Polynucleobacter sp. IMCC30063]|uniref:4Fe-4S cluster-binding domain-containing protein n=1 Tax=Polynucleobacter sp. IMCC30063 TaxID=2907298 RepID=UPI001F373196|nr:4Fe-4S cluster-binding domain-containing protein [Polynucleobacter sp. IMCC30063]MCE7505284.1 radical SAM protein [Polynucleobacter sp. IMCC30063]